MCIETPTLLTLPEEVVLEILKAYFGYNWSFSLQTENAEYHQEWPRQPDGALWQPGENRTYSIDTPDTAPLLVNKKMHLLADDALKSTFSGTIILIGGYNDARSEIFQRCKPKSIIAWVRENGTTIKAHGIYGCNNRTILPLGRLPNLENFWNAFPRLKRIELQYEDWWVGDENIDLDDDKGTQSKIRRKFKRLLEGILNSASHRVFSKMVYAHDKLVLKFELHYIVIPSDDGDVRLMKCVAQVNKLDCVEGARREYRLADVQLGKVQWDDDVF